MPSRNILKIDLRDTYYHVYARGVNKQSIFIEPDDYFVFMHLLKRYLSKKQAKNPHGIPYPHLYEKIENLAFCLMPNHFHLLVYQIEPGSMTQLMRGVMTSYSRYFNTKYTRRGPLFESRYKASNINHEAYLMHISRYIHLNPKNWSDYRYSSLPYYLGELNAEWVTPKKILNLFNGTNEYIEFVADYREHKKVLDEIKMELAV